MKQLFKHTCFLALILLGLTACNDDNKQLPIEEELTGSFIGSYNNGTIGIDSIKITEDGKPLQIGHQTPISNGLNFTTTKGEGNSLNIAFRDFYLPEINLSNDFEINNVRVTRVYDTYILQGETTIDLPSLGEYTVTLNGSANSYAIGCTIRMKNNRQLENIGDGIVSTLEFNVLGIHAKGTENNEARIESFEFNTSTSNNKKAELQGGTIDQIKHTIDYTCKPGADLKALKPTITVSPKETAKVYPASDSEVNFSSGQWIFSAVAEDGTKINYIVTITPRLE